MKRDPELVRNFLLEMVESPYNHFEARLALCDGPLEKGTHTEEGKKNQKKAEHIRWMLDAGFLARLGGSYVRVTADGCDFLENSLNEGVWAETKKTVSATGGSVSLEVLKAVATGLVKKKINDLTGMKI